MSRALLTAAALAAALAVSGCGKKPKMVDPPQGKENDHFPRAYPAPQSVDPSAKPAPPPKDPGPNLGTPNAGTSPDDPPSPLPTVGGFRFP